MSTQWLRLWVRRVVIDGVCAAALERIRQMHNLAASGDKEGMADAGSLRAQADAMHADYKEVKEAVRRAVSMGGDSVDRRTDRSVHAQDGSNATSVDVSVPKSTRELLLGTVMAAQFLALIVLSYLLHDAWKDMRTQVWLRDDALTKFTTGPYAELKAQEEADRMLLYQELCTKGAKP